MLLFAAIITEAKQEIELDEGLFPSIATGDEAAFCTLYQQAGRPVFAYALSLLQNRTDAEDAMQDVFLKIRAAAHLYRPQGKPLAWIFTITRNVCLMKLRRQKYRAALPGEEAPPPLNFHEIEDADDRLVLETAFRVLSEEERRIVFLHAVSGLKHREIAALTALPLSTVLSKFHRGLKKLKAELEGSL